MKFSRTMGIGLILLAAILWGTTGTAQTFATLSLSAYWIGTARLAIAAGFFVIFLTLTNREMLSLSHFKATRWTLVLTAAVSMSVYNLAFFAGVRETGVAIGAAIALGSGPIWAGVLQALWFRKLPGKAWWLAVTVAITGLTLATVSPSSLNVPLSPKGISFCLLSGFSYALYALVSKQLLNTASAISITSLVFISAALCSLPVAWMVSGMPEIATSDIAVLLWLGIVATGIAYLLFNIGLQYVSGATSVALALAEPIAALVLAIVVVGEQLSAESLTGMLLVFAGLFLLVRTEKQA